MEVTATQRLDWDQCWDFHPQDSHPIGAEDSVLGLKECENSHTLTATSTGSNNTQKEVNNQTDYQNQYSVPPKGPFFTSSWSWMKLSTRHTLSNKNSVDQKSPDTCQSMSSTKIS